MDKAEKAGLSSDELNILIAVLTFSTEVYEDRKVTIKDSPSEHLVYLKEKCLLTKYDKRLREVYS